MPLVTIGLPVRNGARYVGEAIESVLAQDFPDWELVICDNASDDGTEAICRSYQRRDRRTSYHRSVVDLGSVPNHARALRRARGSYFKWLAHDDVLRSDFIRCSLAALEREPTAVLAYSAVDVIGELGQALYRDPARLPRTGPDCPRTAGFADTVLTEHNCYAFFGLMPTEVARGLKLAAYDGADRAMIAELSLMGSFAYVDEPLWKNRDHPDRYIRKVRPNPHTSLAWWDTAAPPSTHHYWRLWRAYHAMVSRHVPPGRDRWSCRVTLLRWLAVDWQWLHLAVDAVGAFAPTIYATARRWKRRIDPPVDPRTHRRRA